MSLTPEEQIDMQLTMNRLEYKSYLTKGGLQIVEMFLENMF